jgi:hypothetical protein
MRPESERIRVRISTLKDLALSYRIDTGCYHFLLIAFFFIGNRLQQQLKHLQKQFASKCDIPVVDLGKIIYKKGENSHKNKIVNGYLSQRIVAMRRFLLRKYLTVEEQ